MRKEARILIDRLGRKDLLLYVIDNSCLWWSLIFFFPIMICPDIISVQYVNNELLNKYSWKIFLFKYKTFGRKQNRTTTIIKVIYMMTNERMSEVMSHLKRLNKYNNSKLCNDYTHYYVRLYRLNQLRILHNSRSSIWW